MAPNVSLAPCRPPAPCSFVPKGADQCVCVQRKVGDAVVPKGAGLDHVRTQSNRAEGDNNGDPWVLIDSGASVSIEPMPRAWANGRRIPREAQKVTVVLGVGTVDGYKVGSTVYTWPSAGVSEPLIPWGGGGQSTTTCGRT